MKIIYLIIGLFCLGVAITGWINLLVEGWDAMTAILSLFNFIAGPIEIYFGLVD